MIYQENILIRSALFTREHLGAFIKERRSYINTSALTQVQNALSMKSCLNQKNKSRVLVS